MVTAGREAMAAAPERMRHLAHVLPIAREQTDADSFPRNLPKQNPYLDGTHGANVIHDSLGLLVRGAQLLEVLRANVRPGHTAIF